MSFDRAGLNKVSSGANSLAPTIWSYTTEDSAADVDTEDYFLPAMREIKKGDIMYWRTSTGSTDVITVSYCNQSDGTNIDFVDGDVISNTDGD